MKFLYSFFMQEIWDNFRRSKNFNWPGKFFKMNDIKLRASRIIQENNLDKLIAILGSNKLLLSESNFSIKYALYTLFFFFQCLGKNFRNTNIMIYLWIKIVYTLNVILILCKSCVFYNIEKWNKVDISSTNSQKFGTI